MEGIFMIVLFLALAIAYAAETLASTYATETLASTYATETNFPEGGRVKKSYDSIEEAFNNFQIKHNTKMKPSAQSRVDDKSLSVATKLMLEEELDHKIRDLKKAISSSNLKSAWSPENGDKSIHEHDVNPKFRRQTNEKLDNPEPDWIPPDPDVATKPESEKKT